MKSSLVSNPVSRFGHFPFNICLTLWVEKLVRSHYWEKLNGKCPCSRKYSWSLLTGENHSSWWRKNGEIIENKMNKQT